jgi:hypothetical protein
MIPALQALVSSESYGSEVVSGASGRYRVGETIGRGGLGEVFRGEDTQLNRLVAIKRLHTEGSAATCMPWDVSRILP